MDLEMIINCKVPSLSMRVRDTMLCFLSLLLWAQFLVLLFRIETWDVVKFLSFFYIAMVLLVGGLLVAWSLYHKTMFRCLTKKQNRRTRYTSLAPEIMAKYFCMDEKQVCALQYEKCTLIQHGKEGETSSILFHNPPSTPAVLLTLDKMPFSVAS